MSNIRFYKNRNSATAYLRGKGIHNDHYSDFAFKVTPKDKAPDGMEYKIDIDAVANAIKPAPEKTLEELITNHPSVQSAESELKAMGLKKSDWSKFIVVKNRSVKCLNTKAELFLMSSQKKSKQPHVMAELGNVPKETPMPRDNKPGYKIRGISGRCRELILSGKSNDEVWSIIKKEFDLSDDKKYYPHWNRTNMKKKGLI